MSAAPPAWDQLFLQPPVIAPACFWPLWITLVNVLTCTQSQSVLIQTGSSSNKHHLIKPRRVSKWEFIKQIGINSWRSGGNIIMFYCASVSGVTVCPGECFISAARVCPSQYFDMRTQATNWKLETKTDQPGQSWISGWGETRRAESGAGPRSAGRSEMRNVIFLLTPHSSLSLRDWPEAAICIWLANCALFNPLIGQSIHI